MCSWWFRKISENFENYQFLKIHKKSAIIKMSSVWCFSSRVGVFAITCIWNRWKLRSKRLISPKSWYLHFWTQKLWSDRKFYQNTAKLKSITMHILWQKFISISLGLSQKNRNWKVANCGSVYTTYLNYHGFQAYRINKVVNHLPQLPWFPGLQDQWVIYHLPQLPWFQG